MTHPALAPLLERLARLRARVRRLLAISGTAQVVVWAAGIAGVWFLADYLLDLPVGVRRFVRLGLLDRPAGLSFGLYAALLATSAFGLYAGVRRRSGVAGFFAFSTAGVLGLLVWVFVRRLASPLRVRLSDETLALSVEERQKKWNDRLAAALDFDQELAAPSRGESTGMMTRVLEDASREAQGIEFAGVASGRHARRLVGLAALSVAAVATLFAAMPATAALWFRRSLTLEDVSWPQATTLVAIVRGPDGSESDKDATVPYTAALGQPLTVYARAIGRVPSEVEIVDRVLDEGAGGPPARAPHARGGRARGALRVRVPRRARRLRVRLPGRRRPRRAADLPRGRARAAAHHRPPVRPRLPGVPLAAPATRRRRHAGRAGGHRDLDRVLVRRAGREGRGVRRREGRRARAQRVEDGLLLPLHARQDGPATGCASSRRTAARTTRPSTPTR